MLTDTWQIPPRSLLLPVVYPLPRFTVLPSSLSPIQCGFASCSPYMYPWYGQANAASCRTLHEAALFLSFMPFLLWLLFSKRFFPWKTFPHKSLARETSSLGLLRGIPAESHLLSKYLGKQTNMKKEASLLHGNNTIDKSKQIGKTHSGHVTKHSFPWYIRALESESCSVLYDSLWSHGLCSPWNSPDQNTAVSE